MKRLIFPTVERQMEEERILNRLNKNIIKFMEENPEEMKAEREGYIEELKEMPCNELQSEYEYGIFTLGVLKKSKVKGIEKMIKAQEEVLKEMKVIARQKSCVLKSL